MAIDRSRAKDLIARGQLTITNVSLLANMIQRARQEVQTTFEAAREQRVWRDLADISIERVKDVTGGRLRLGVLRQYRLETIADVLVASPSDLMTIPGVGEATATKVSAAADQIRRTVRESMRFRIDLDPGDTVATALLHAVSVWETVRGEAHHVEAGRDLARTLSSLCAGAAPAAAGALRRFFYGQQRKVEGSQAAAQLELVLGSGEVRAVEAAERRASAATSSRPNARLLWEDFSRRSAVYYGLLGGVVDLGVDVAAADGFLPAEIVHRVNAQLLDDSQLRTSLRGYQAFGARFALVQRRVIIGDEMGLGKTIEAIAAMAHLSAAGETHFLVVCPASVLINWMREIGQHSTLRPVLLHGSERTRASRLWAERGGVGVTTFDTLAVLHLGSRAPAMLVVDEAHYAKNPTAKRTRAVGEVASRAERVLFMTGTPMENRVDEFSELVRHLQPEVARRIDPRHGIAGPEVFRRAVAPVYLRRNQADVLSELPPLIQVDEWEEFGASDAAAYWAAVREGNFMAMRRAAFVSRDSAKSRRLTELVNEATANGHKVVVFSFFRDVIDVVSQVLGGRTYGPITGSMSSAARQHVVDEFTQARQAGVLVAQIEAGGVGLNIQAASVVILCEPQVKPSTEAQAIARAHRMGQVRSVQVHRLLVAHSVDQRMLEILGTKRALFDAYVRDSAVTAAAPGAVDISEVQLARTIVEQEQERLALASMGTDG